MLALEFDSRFYRSFAWPNYLKMWLRANHLQIFQAHNAQVRKKRNDMLAISADPRTSSGEGFVGIKGSIEKFTVS
jgi:hypothetical protein